MTLKWRMTLAVARRNAIPSFERYTLLPTHLAIHPRPAYTSAMTLEPQGLGPRAASIPIEEDMGTFFWRSLAARAVRGSRVGSMAPASAFDRGLRPVAWRPLMNLG